MGVIVTVAVKVLDIFVATVAEMDCIVGDTVVLGSKIRVRLGVNVSVGLGVDVSVGLGVNVYVGGNSVAVGIEVTVISVSNGS